MSTLRRRDLRVEARDRDCSEGRKRGQATLSEELPQPRQPPTGSILVAHETSFVVSC
jgi:hypothetical protein